MLLSLLRAASVKCTVARLGLWTGLVDVRGTSLPATLVGCYYT